MKNDKIKGSGYFGPENTLEEEPEAQNKSHSSFTGFGSKIFGLPVRRRRRRLLFVLQCRTSRVCLVASGFLSHRLGGAVVEWGLSHSRSVATFFFLNLARKASQVFSTGVVLFYFLSSRLLKNARIMRGGSVKGGPTGKGGAK